MQLGPNTSFLCDSWSQSDFSYAYKHIQANKKKAVEAWVIDNIGSLISYLNLITRYITQNILAKQNIKQWTKARPSAVELKQKWKNKGLRWMDMCVHRMKNKIGF